MPYYFANPTPIFAPAVRDLLSITSAYPAVFTTTYDGTNPGAHGYKTGLIVRIDIPPHFGMQQLNQFQGTITVLSPSTFSMNVNTTGMNPFVIPAENPGFNFTPAQVTPIGEVAAQLDQSFVNQLSR